MIRVAAIVLLSALMPVAAFGDDDSRSAREIEQEHRLRHDAAELDEILANSGMLVDDAEAIAYLDGIVARMFPELTGEITVRLVRGNDSNAFSTANGSVYVLTGFLPWVATESQLAMILGHEVEHYLQRHVVSSALSMKTNFAVGNFLSLGIPLVAPLLAASSYSGFSRGLEREADELGFNRLMAAGYAVDDAHLWFERMHALQEALPRRGSRIFSSHPRLEERIRSVQQAAAEHGNTDGDHGRERFLQAMTALRLDALAALAEQRQHVAILVLLEDEQMLASYPPSARYFLGEAYRLRNAEGDLERAGEEITRAAREAPDFAPAWRGLGLHLMRHGDGIAAADALETYLALAPNATDAAFIESYIANLRATAAAPEGENP